MLFRSVQSRYGIPVLEPSVPRSVRFAEAPAQGRSIMEHAPASVGAVAYRELAHEVLLRLGLGAPVATAAEGTA